MSKKLEGKVVVITGASSGIGEATAILLAKHGAKVSLIARREDRLKLVEDKVKNNGGEALSIVGDMSKEKDIEKAISETMDHFGTIDILVNNAGIMLLGPIQGANTNDWKRMVDINLMGLMYCTHKVLPTMVKNNYGHIINISSVAGRVARSGAGVYNATKFAVGAFSESLRQEVVGKNIRVTLIEPGAVLTELTDHITHEESKDKIKSWVETLDALTSEDIAESILYAVSQPLRVNVNEILIRPTEQLI